MRSFLTIIMLLGLTGPALAEAQVYAAGRTAYEDDLKKTDDDARGVAAADKQYLKYLEKLGVEFTSEQKYTKTRAVLEETKRFQTSKRVPGKIPAGLLPRIAAGRVAYRDAIAVDSLDKQKRRIKRTKQYLKKLKKLHAEAVKAADDYARLETAEMSEAEMTRAKKRLEALEARLPGKKKDNGEPVEKKAPAKDGTGAWVWGSCRRHIADARPERLEGF